MFGNRRRTASRFDECFGNGWQPCLWSGGVPDYLRSDNGSEFTARLVRDWLERVGVKTLFLEPGSPWGNGYVESFNGKFRDEFLNGEIFYTLREAKVLIEGWRREYNRVRPHSALGYRPPAPEVILPLPPGFRSAPPGCNGVWTNMEGGPITGGRSGATGAKESVEFP